MVSPDEQLQQQQIGKVEAEKQQDFESFSSCANEAAASHSSLAKPKKMKDLAVANSNTIEDLSDNKDQSNSRTIYGISTLNYKNKIGYQIATAEKSVDDLLLNQKRVFNSAISQSAPSKHNDSTKDLMIDFPSSHDEAIFNDIQGFFSKSGIAVTPTSFGRLLGCDTRMALSKLTLKNSNSSFVDYSSIDASLPGRATAGSAIKSPTFSMSDIAVVVPSHVVLSDSNSEEVGTDDEPTSDLDRSSSVANNNNSSSDCLYADCNQVLERLERSFESPGGSNKEKVSSGEDSDSQLEVSEVHTPILDSVNCIDVSVDRSVKNNADIGDSSTSTPIDCLGDYRLQIGNEERSISDQSPSSRITFDSATDGRLHCLPNEEKSVSSETATDSTNNAPESCSSFDFADELVDPFEDELNEDASEWQFVASARNKQKRKQNRSQSNSSKRQDRYPTRVKTTPTSTKEFDRLTNSRPAHSTTPRNIPNRILRARAKQQQQQQQQRSSATCKMHTASSNVKVSPSYSPFSRASDSTEVIWSKPVAQTLTTIKDEVRPLDSNIGATEQSAESRIQCESKSFKTLNPAEMNGAVGNSAQTANMYPGQVHYDPITTRANEMNLPGSASANGAAEPLRVNIEQGMNALALASPPADVKPNLVGDELLKVLKKQLEYYFSSENLNKDTYLRSWMDSEQWVPIATIAKFPMITKMTKDLIHVIAALKDSAQLEVDVDEQKVRPLLRADLTHYKHVVILREIPDGVQEEEITALFDGSSAKLSYCTYAGNTNWYVGFQNDSDAQTAYRHLRENVRLFRGKPILARIKTKLHHNPYSGQAAPPATTNTVTTVTIDPTCTTTISTTAPVSQQVTSPVDYVPAPPFMVYPSFAPAPTHLSGQVPQAMPTYMQRLPASLNQTATNAQVPVSAVPLNQAPLGGFVLSQWQGPNFYTTAADGSLMRPPYGGQFLQPVQPTFKPPAIPQYPLQNAGTATKLPTTTNQRFVDYQDANQKNAFSTVKPPATTYSQHPAQPISNGAPLTSQAPQSYYVLADASQTNSDMIQYVPTEQPAYGAVPPVAANTHPIHYLPAVNRPPFVTPNANDPNILVAAAAVPGIPPPLQPMHFRNSGKRTEALVHHVVQPVYSAADQNGSSNHRVPYSTASRSSTTTYPPELSPRFLHKSAQQGYAPMNHAYSGTPYVHRQASREHPSEMKMSYSNKTSNSYPGHDQRGKNSPLPTPSEAYADQLRMNSTGTEQHNQTRRHSYNRRAVNGPSGGPASHSEQRNAYHQSGLERRNNMRQPRRARRPEDEIGPHPIPYAISNTPFNLESNSFPPLPGAQASGSSSTNQVVDNRPAAADVVKGVEHPKVSVTHVSQSAASVKKYAELSNASYGPRSVPARQSRYSEGPRNREAKTVSAVNTQLVADKSPPVVARQPRQTSSGDKPQNDVAKPSSQLYVEEPPINQEPNCEVKQPAASVVTLDTKNPQASPTKSVVSSKSEPDTQSKEDLEVQVKDKTEQEKDTAPADSKPTYAEMLKMKRAAAAAAQLNGKETSDSGKSDSSEETRSSDDAKDFESTSEKTGSSKVDSVLSDEDNHPAKYDRRDDRRNGNYESRRGGPWQPRHYQDRNDDYRRYPRRDWGYDRGYRGRGSYRGRRMFRENRYHNVSNSKPVPNNKPVSNGQAALDR